MMGFAAYLRRRRYRREHRAMVSRYYAEGGDVRFRFDYELTPDALVLDLGGYEGQWASDLYSRQRCRIRIFEPVRRFAAAIEHRFHRNPDIEVFPYALGGSTRQGSVSLRGASSSAFKRKAQQEPIEYVDVAQWFADQGVGDVRLMKVNIEGGEYELLERLLETGLAQRVQDLQVQFHNFSADATKRMEAIQRGLGATHDCTYHYRFVWENWRRRDA